MPPSVTSGQRWVKVMCQSGRGAQPEALGRGPWETDRFGFKFQPQHIPARDLGHVLHFLWTSVFLSSGINRMSSGWCENLGDDTWKAEKHWVPCMAGDKHAVNVSILSAAPISTEPIYTHTASTPPPGNEKILFYFFLKIVTLGIFIFFKFTFYLEYNGFTKLC